MGSDMIERVARALVTCEAWSSFWSDDDARILARAAIAAMRRPSRAMYAALLAALRDRGDADDTDLACQVYQDMIDAALAEGPAKPPNKPV